MEIQITIVLLTAVLAVAVTVYWGKKRAVPCHYGKVSAASMAA